MLLSLVFVAQGYAFIHANSQTTDEAAHLAAGYSYLTTNDFRMNPEHPPLLKVLAALPVYLVYHLPFCPSPEEWGRLTQYGFLQWEIAAILSLAVVLVIPPIYWFRDLSPWLGGVRAQFGHQGGGHPAFLLGQISHHCFARQRWFLPP